MKISQGTLFKMASRHINRDNVLGSDVSTSNSDSFSATSSLNIASELELETWESNTLSQVTSREAVSNNYHRKLGLYSSHSQILLWWLSCGLVCQSSILEGRELAQVRPVDMMHAMLRPTICFTNTKRLSFKDRSRVESPGDLIKCLERSRI